MNRAAVDRHVMTPRTLRATAWRGPTLFAVSAIAALFAVSAAAAATTYMAARQVSDTGARRPSLNVALEFNSQPTSQTAGGGWMVVDGLQAGSRDRLKLTGLGFADYIGRTFYAGLSPIFGQQHLNVESASLTAWATAFDDDGTLDEELGIAFGEVRDASGTPIAGATVTITPEGGSVFYFDDAGEPDGSLTQTSASGRYLILDIPPGNVAVNAAFLPEGDQDDPLGHGVGTLLGRAYGRVNKNQVTGMLLDPVESISGSAVDETGAAVPGARIEWDFDTDFAEFADGGGLFTIDHLATGIDVTVRGTATGHRNALTLRRSRQETPDPSNIQVGFVSEGAYAAWGTVFTPPQDPLQGMIAGRVVDSGGSPLAGATVTVEPEVGQVHYFDAAGVPSASQLQTSSAGTFLVLNVPTGLVTLSAVGPGQVIRRELAPTEAGAVTQGELRGLPLVNVRGKVVDEQQRADTVAGAVVAVVEYPQVATIAGSDPLRCDSCFSLNVPVGEMLTFRAGREGFKTSLSFTEPMPATPFPCAADDPDETETTSREDCKDLFLISEVSYTNLYTAARQVANRAQGLVAAGVFLSNGDLDDTANIPTAAIGLNGQLTPDSAAPRYLTDGRFDKNAISTAGSVQFLNAQTSIAGLSIFDQRNDEATLAIVKIVPDAVTLTDGLRLDCDTHTEGVFANIYPCNGARMTNAGKDAFFQWDLGDNIRAQVQFSTDPAFGSIAKTSGNRLFRKEFWHASAKTWKKIKKLAAPGGAVYWRVLAKDVDDVTTVTAPYVFHVP